MTAAPSVQKSRAGQRPDDATLATYTAARAFLYAEWLGSVLMLASFTQLYAVGLGGGSPRVAWLLGAALMLVGSWMFLANRQYYERLEWPWRRRWHVVAGLMAATAALFWAMVLVATWMTWEGWAPF